MDIRTPLTQGQEKQLCRNPSFEEFLIVEYGAWLLYLNSKQQLHLGRAYAWLRSRHIDLHPFERLTINESLELRLLLQAYRKALTTVVGVEPALINCEWLGNEVHLHRGHGHMHFIPRYQETPSFLGVQYPDQLFGGRSTYKESDAMSHEMFLELRDALRVQMVRK